MKKQKNSEPKKKKLVKKENLSKKQLYNQELSKVIHECYELIEAAIQQTEESAHTLLSVVEKQLDSHQEREEAVLFPGLAPEIKEKISALDSELKKDLTESLALLSYQDLVGQRLKKVVKKLEQVEGSIHNKTALIQREEEKLLGPTVEANQSNVDDLLADLGL